MNVEDIIMLDDYDIDYAALPDDTLGQLALCNELYIATSALSELSERNSTLVMPIAWQIIATEHGAGFVCVHLRFHMISKPRMNADEPLMPQGRFPIFLAAQKFPHRGIDSRRFAGRRCRF